MLWSANDAQRTAPRNLFLVSRASDLERVHISPAASHPAFAKSDIQASNGTASDLSPMPGDDPSPPNACEASKMNAIAVHAVASAGWSSSAHRPIMPPSSVHYDVRLTDSMNIELGVTLEYVNPHPGESMLLKVKVAKAALCAGRPLHLVTTTFHDLVDGAWVDISTTVAHTAAAQAVVTAVVMDETAGQTAGMATSGTETVDVQLGPVGARGRVHLSYVSQGSFSYEATAIAEDASDVGAFHLRPVAVFLPWAQLDDEAGDCAVTVSFAAPPGTRTLPVSTSRQAYSHLAGQPIMRDMALLAATDLHPGKLVGVGAEFSWPALPTTPTCVLFWLALPNDDFVDLGSASLPAPVTRARVLAPAPDDAALLRVSMPGPGPPAHLLRVNVSLPPSTAHDDGSARLIVNLTFSDSSGSTGMRCREAPGAAGGGCVRDRFNDIAERRFLRRLSAIPGLVSAGVLQPRDVWTDVFFAFDHAIIDTFRVAFRVGDLVDKATAEAIAAAAAQPPGALALNQAPQQVRAVCASIADFLRRIRKLTPQGGTSFVAPAKAAWDAYDSVTQDARKLLPAGADKVLTTAFLDFDTDGGDNGPRPACYAAVRAVVDKFRVRGGVVTGFGAWVDAECASRVAEILDASVPALLALHVPAPGDEGLDRVFRAGFSAWVSALRSLPVTLTVSGGAITDTHPRVGERHLNGIEVLAARRVRCRATPAFAALDVSDPTCTGAVIEGLTGGDEVMLFLASRLPTADLLQGRLKLTVGNGTPAEVSSRAEPLRSTGLAYDWLQVLTGHDSDTVMHAAVAVPHLLTRFEDDVAFAFNLASPSGATSYLGRAKTRADRPAIDAAHQPRPPKLPMRPPPPEPAPFLFGCSSSSRAGGPGAQFAPQAPGGAGLFGASAPAVLFGSPPVPAANVSAPAVYRCAMPGIQAVQPKCSALAFGAPAAAAPPAPAAAGRGALFGRMASGSSSLFTSLRRKSDAAAAAAPRQRAPADGGAELPAAPSHHDWTDVLARSWDLRCPSESSAAKPPLFSSPPDVAGAFASLRSSIARLTGSLSFVCDVCNRDIPTGAARVHCLDCLDYDECVNCRGTHASQNPTHALRIVGDRNAGAATTPPPAEDPLVAQLLGAPGKDVAVMGAPAGDDKRVDHAAELCERRLKRLLGALLGWWTVLRAVLWQAPRLPDELPADVLAGVTSALGASTVALLTGMATTVVDSIEREMLGSQVKGIPRAPGFGA